MQEALTRAVGSEYYNLGAHLVAKPRRRAEVVFELRARRSLESFAMTNMAVPQWKNQRKMSSLLKKVGQFTFFVGKTIVNHPQITILWVV